MKPNDLRILDALAMPATARELGAALQLSQATICKWLTRLRDDGYVRLATKRPGVRRPHHVWERVPPGSVVVPAGLGYRADPLMGALYA